MGENIEIVHSAHNTAGYILKNKRFTFNEIRFIVDSISINKFLSNGQKQRLIKKFERLCSEENASRFISRISLNNKEPASANLLENLDKVHNIISHKCNNILKATKTPSPLQLQRDEVFMFEKKLI